MGTTYSLGKADKAAMVSGLVISVTQNSLIVLEASSLIKYKNSPAQSDSNSKAFENLHMFTARSIKTVPTSEPNYFEGGTYTKSANFVKKPSSFLSSYFNASIASLHLALFDPSEAFVKNPNA